MTYPGFDTQWLTQHGAVHTAQEIAHQPRLWREMAATLTATEADDNAFLQPLFALPGFRIVMTGAGTSAYAGEALAPWLVRQGMDARAVATTDIVSNPREYLDPNAPTLLVSFARSGNSPESVAAVAVADQTVTNIWHLILTCNGEGELYRYAQQSDKARCHLMPEGSNDKSFAMTSSYTCMTLSAIVLLGSATRAACTEQVERVASCVENGTAQWADKVNTLAEMDYQRLIILGSGGLAGVAREGALKSLELSAGRVVTGFESSLGFRHGPKFMINPETLVIQFFSTDSYTRQYDRDMYSEIRANGKTLSHIALTAVDEGDIDGEFISVADAKLDDVWLTFPYIVFAQMLAMTKSLQLGLTPDNPCPSGEVNRVVQGVTIYPFS
ncbi:SIS domain-containing protein [Enterovibrio paralichthyis]|uniref:SIS domain-containing protein n=1 Tax=Enterovibrio paralichthyis TaxID=2853805 RepID=UPI001C4426F2|nr:SIS domain-containing protein [Enterovibrio paralichthyis]MBV7298231.1 SIS domain-containing protein [Enterovibrio paralichthyis]